MPKSQCSTQLNWIKNWAQQNYPVHEVEMFAGAETMLWHEDILQEVKFQWLTDHSKGLIYLLNQKNLSGCQARWLEKISTFAGSENVVEDALSCIYSNDSVGTVHARSKHTYHDVLDNNTVSGGVLAKQWESPHASRNRSMGCHTTGILWEMAEGCHGGIELLRCHASRSAGFT